MHGFKFKYLTPEDKDTIVTLRKEAYEDYYGSQVDLRGLEWNYTDQNSVHLSFWNDSELASYLRLSLFQDKARLERTTLFPTPEDLKFPIALLARAATKKKFSGRHLHNILRAFALETCSKINISTVLGSLEERSSRLKSLESFGYKVLQKQPSWEGSYIKAPERLFL